MTLPLNALDQIKQYFLQLQTNLCQQFEELDQQKHFIADHWKKDNYSHGITCILSQGGIFEKAGVNFSSVVGAALPAAATANRPELVGRTFSAMGVSLVIHPDNPHIPTSHANVRFFMAEKANEPPVWWFGGGFDLTPYYGYEEDCIHWHRIAKQACQAFGDDLYPRFKHWCDQYFYLPHRKKPVVSVAFF